MIYAENMRTMTLLPLLLVATALLLVVTVTSAQVFVTPRDNLVSIPGGSATFFCFASAISTDAIVSVQWLLNGTLLDDLGLTDVDTSSEVTLRFSPVSSDHNRTRVSCRATLESGAISISPVSVLLIQGLLSAPGSLNTSVAGSYISLTWTAPFTLDITSVEHDITYCVDVVNSTSSETVRRECGIIGTGFSCSIPRETDCYVYNFTVTPMNDFGAGENSTRPYAGAETKPEVMNAQRMPGSSSNSDPTFSFQLHMTARVCVLKSLDIADMSRNAIELNAIATELDNNTIILSTALLIHRHYNVTIGAENSAGSIESYTTISTHDITAVIVTETENNGIRVTTSYFEPSSASGALYMFVFISGSGVIDLGKSFFLPLSMDLSRNYVLPFSLSAGRYRAYAYDIEEDGTLPNGVGYPANELTANTNEFVVTGSGQAPQPLLNHIEACDVTTVSSRYNISVTCTYSVSGFQVVVLLQSLLDQVGKLYVNQTMDGQTSASVVVKESGLYLVSIIPIVEGTGITDSRVECTEMVMVDDQATTDIPGNNHQGAIVAGVLIPVIVAALVVVVVVVVYLMVMKKHKECDNPENKECPQDNRTSPSTTEKIFSLPMKIVPVKQSESEGVIPDKKSDICPTHSPTSFSSVESDNRESTPLMSSKAKGKDEKDEQFHAQEETSVLTTPEEETDMFGDQIARERGVRM